jgi:lysophospholipase L1-like esterase
VLGPKALGDAHFDAELITRFNQIIRSLAAKHGVPVIDLSALADDGGLAKAGSTTDGVHLTGGGYDIWRSAIENGSKAAIRGCPG